MAEPATRKAAASGRQGGKTLLKMLDALVAAAQADWETMTPEERAEWERVGRDLFGEGEGAPDGEGQGDA